MEAVQKMTDAPHSRLRMLDGHSANDAMNLVSFVEKQFRQITPVLAGNSGNQGFFHLASFSEAFGSTTAAANTAFDRQMVKIRR
jgi:hypothetical protein